MWQQWINGILGLWVLIASYLYVPSGGDRVAMLITGIVVALLGFWGAASSNESQSSSRNQMQH